MGLWMWRVGGCLLLLVITLFAVVAVTDVYTSLTALRGGGVPGTMIIASQDRTLPIDFFCFAEGQFAPDSGGPVVDMALAGWCGEPGTEVKVRYVPSLREHLPLLQVGVARGTWAELATATAGGSILIGVAIVAWWAAAGIMLDPGVSEERYGAIRVASNCAEADLVDWLQENFDAAWVDPLPTGGSAVNLAILDANVILSENLENISDVGRSLAEMGGIACILWWPHHIHFEGDSIEEAQSWGACSLQPDDVSDMKNVTLLRHDPQDGMPGVDVDTGAVMRGGWLLIPGDSASHNSDELHTSAAVLGVKGNEVNLAVHENGRLVGRAQWNHPGHLVGNRGGTFDLRAICPSWPAPLWADEIEGFRMPGSDELEKVLNMSGDPERLIPALAYAFGLPAVDVLVDDLTGQKLIADLPDAVIIKALREHPSDKSD